MKIKSKSKVVLEVDEAEIGLIMDALDYISATGRMGWTVNAHGREYKMPAVEAEQSRQLFDTLAKAGYRQARTLSRV